MDIISLLSFIVGGVASCVTVIMYLDDKKQKKNSSEPSTRHSNKILVSIFLTAIFLAIGLSKTVINIVPDIKPQIDYNWSVSRVALTRTIVLYLIELVLSTTIFLLFRYVYAHASTVTVLFSLFMILVVAPVNALWLGFRVLSNNCFESWFLAATCMGSYFSISLFVSLFLFSRK